MKIQNIEDLDAWRESMVFCEMIYKLTNTLPESEKYNLVKHLRESARGVGANIAEGFGRYFYKENLRFYGIAKGCLNEVINDLHIGYRVSYIDKDTFDDYMFQANKVQSILNGLINVVLNRLKNATK
ncbi:MAG: four helix bundle protein [Patescibacteria group bacterium]